VSVSTCGHSRPTAHVDRDVQHSLRLAVLGDSLAHGVGAAHTDDTLGARLAGMLDRSGHAVELHVLAVPGATSFDLAAQVRRAAPLGVDLAVVVVGANDLPRMIPPDRSAAALRTAIETLQGSGTTVVVVPAPDLSTVPWVPPALRPALRAACAELQRRQTAAAETAGAVVAPVAGQVAAAFAADPTLFCADRFHPSSAGYARIAAALGPTVTNAATAHRTRAA
jgi:lysophospholipase L1-like esterase